MAWKDGSTSGGELHFLAVDGEMGRLIAAHDWQAASMGPPETWPPPLRTSLSTCLASPLVSAVLWGPDHRLLYNDAYATVFAERHPWALGRPIIEVFAEIADLLSPQLEAVRGTGRGFATENQKLMLERGGRAEETYWVYSFAPIRDEDGAVAGIFNTAIETTSRVLADRRLKNAAMAAGLSADFRALFDASPTPFLVVAPPDWTIVAANDARLEVTGTTREEQIGRKLFDAFPDDPDDPSADGVKNLTASLLRVLATKASDVMAVQRYAVREADGRFVERWWSPLNTPVLDQAGEVALIIHRVEEVTEMVRLRGEAQALDQLARDQQAVIDRLRASEAALRDSEARYRTLFENIDAAFCVVEVIFDDDGRPIDHRFIETNPAFERQSGLKDALGKRAREILPDHEQHWFDTYGRLVATGGSIRFENGSDALGRWFDVHAMRVGPRDQNRVAILFNDISARKAAEDRLRDLNDTLEQRVADRTAELSESQRRFQGIFDSAFQFMALLTPEGTVLEVNQTALSWSQIEPSDIVGKPFWLAAPMRGDPALQAAVEAGIRRAAAGETVRAEHEMRGTGEVRAMVDFSLKPVPGEGGEPVWLVAEGRDITELKAAQEALRQSQKLEAMGALTGGVAHDVNNLLTPITGALDLLQRRGVGGDREQRLIAGALQSADRAKTLVQRLLAFARRQPLQPKPVDVGSLITGMADLVASTSGPQTKVVVNLAEDLPAAVADPNQLEMAILNLSVNARDAMPDGGRLVITADDEHVGSGHRAGLLPGRYVRLSVADTGCGMDEATLARAIEPFYSTKGVGKGTGLGLSMVHGLAAQLGGGLRIDSRPGLGTNVELWLPATEASAERAEQTEDAAAGAGAGTALLVDDEELVRASTADMLGDLGYAVVEACSAEEALRHLDGGLVPHLLVTDHLMPGMSGTELAREVLGRLPGTRVLVVSGYAEVASMAPDLGRLIKPFRQADLAAKLAGASGEQ